MGLFGCRLRSESSGMYLTLQMRPVNFLGSGYSRLIDLGTRFHRRSRGTGSSRWEILRATSPFTKHLDPLCFLYLFFFPFSFSYVS